MSGLTPSQTVGPYFHIGLDWPGGNRLVRADTPGRHIVLRGRVLDGDGEPVPDALLEIWQADADGVYRGTADDDFRGAGRCATDADGAWCFETVKPGPVAGPGAVQAPHVNVVVFARGLLVHLYTRAYFEDDAAANAADPILQCVPEARRGTLLARGEDDCFRLDIHLQGARETVFLDV